ncbi:MAG: hypothetical protein VCA18_08450 [Opitutales bacterium]
MAVLLLDQGDLEKDLKDRERLLDALEKLESKPIPPRDKVVSAEIHLRYPWSK